MKKYMSDKVISSVVLYCFLALLIVVGLLLA